MVLEKMPNGNSIYYASPYIVSVAYQYMEHYDLFTDVIFCINIDFISIKNIKKENVNKKIIYVNLEHKYPIDENGNLKYCNSYYNINHKGMYKVLFLIPSMTWFTSPNLK